MQVDYTKKFTKHFAKLDRQIQLATRDRIFLFVSDPFLPLLNNHELYGKYVGLRSINVTGDWRALYREVNSTFVRFEFIGTHSELYG